MTHTLKKYLPHPKSNKHSIQIPLPTHFKNAFHKYSGYSIENMYIQCIRTKNRYVSLERYERYRAFFYVTALFFYDPTNFNTGSTEMLKKIAQSDAGAVLSKSATLKSQKGNPLPRTWKNEGVASLNSEGLPNYVCYFFIFLSEFP